MSANTKELVSLSSEFIINSKLNKEQVEIFKLFLIDYNQLKNEYLKSTLKKSFEEMKEKEL